MVAGDESQWTVDILNKYNSLIPFSTARSLSMIDGRIVRDSLSQLGQIKTWKDSQGYAMIRQLTASNSSGLSRTTNTSFKTFMDRLDDDSIFL